MGHEVTMAFRDSSFIESARAEGFETFIAPLLKIQREMNPSPLNFSDVLLNLGFRDARGIAGALRAWQSMFEMLAPDVLVAEYAPTALIAALLAGIRRVTVSAGFSVPVLRDPLPDLRPWQPTDPKILRALDDRLLTTIRHAAGASASRLPDRARDLFNAEAHLLCTFREIDPFGPRDGVEYVGPPADSVGGADIPWMRESGPHVFAYLKPRSPRFDAVIAALASLDAEVIVAAPGLTLERANAMSTASMRVVARGGEPGPRDAERVAVREPCRRRASRLARWRQACPMALLPLQLDQFLIAKRIEQTGAALVSNPEEPAPDFRAWFSIRCSRNRDFARRRIACAKATAPTTSARAAARAAERIAEVAATLTMARIAFAWEMGGELGHAMACNSLALAMRAARPSRRIHVPRAAWPFAPSGHRGPRRLPGARVLERRRRPAVPSSFADILLGCGYDRPAASRRPARRMVRALRALEARPRRHRLRSHGTPRGARHGTCGA